MVANVRERLAVSKQAVEKFDMERFSLRKPNELEVRKQYQINISNRFATWENFSDSLGMYKLKQHKPWLDEECLCFLNKGSRLKCSGYRIQTKAM